jgi:dTDP-4-amino-4,6-dideoxygalactose transaminase
MKPRILLPEADEAINDSNYCDRAEIIWEKVPTDRFFRGEIDKYGWVDTGSSFYRK